MTNQDQKKDDICKICGKSSCQIIDCDQWNQVPLEEILLIVFSMIKTLRAEIKA
jgi:hypothetical protein